MAVPSGPAVAVGRRVRARCLRGVLDLVAATRRRRAAVIDATPSAAHERRVYDSRGPRERRAPVDAIASAQVRARTIPRLSTPEPGSLLAPRGFLRPTTHQRARESNARERFRSSPDGRDASLVFVAPPSRPRSRWPRATRSTARSKTRRQSTCARQSRARRRRVR